MTIKIRTYISFLFSVVCLAWMAAGAAFSQEFIADGASVELNIQETHANGSLLQITGLQAGLSETLVNVQFINGYKNDIKLAARGKDSFLENADGSRLYLSPPADNGQFVVPGKTKVEGVLVFLGRLQSANTARLVLNDKNGNDRANSLSPRFDVSLDLKNIQTGPSLKKN